MILRCSGDFHQLSCIEFFPNTHLQTSDVVKSSYLSSFVECIVFCYESGEMFLSASFQDNKHCICHGDIYNQLPIASFESVYMKLELKEPSNCFDIYNCFSRGNGVYNVMTNGGVGLNIYCDMDNGGWTVIQRRFDGSVDFARDYKDYQNGFGQVTGEFWLGLDTIHELVVDGDFEVRFDLEDYEGNARFALYKSFNVGDLKDNYQLNISDYSGTAGDAMKTHNGMLFSAGIIDFDNWRTRCVDRFGGGGWWFNACHNANINGLYNDTTYGLGIVWSQWRGFEYSMKSVSMKIRPRQI